VLCVRKEDLLSGSTTQGAAGPVWQAAQAANAAALTMRQRTGSAAPSPHLELTQHGPSDLTAPRYGQLSLSGHLFSANFGLNATDVIPSNPRGVAAVFLFMLQMWKLRFQLLTHILTS
jgi:hypothetical protein